jgi:uncharacterized damage-inducible protein DinB
MKKRTDLSLTQKAMQALTDAVAKVVEDHRLQARPLALWRDGKATWVSATDEAVALHETAVRYRTGNKK